MKKITKAVIACAGWGTRFLPTVKAYAKPLIPIVDKPQLHHLLDSLVNAGITDIAIVHRHGEKTIRQYLKPNPELDSYLNKTNKTEALSNLNKLIKTVNFKFIPQSPNLPYGNGTPILSAKSFIGQDDFVYLFGDDLLIENKPGTHIKNMINLFINKKADSVIAIQQVPWHQIHKYGAIQFDKKQKNRALGIFEKVPRDQAPSNFSQVSPYILSNKYVNILKSTALGKGNELWLADANHSIAQSGLALTYDLKGDWITTGDPLNWLKANLAMALKHPDYKKDIKSFLKDQIS